MYMYDPSNGEWQSVGEESASYPQLLVESCDQEILVLLGSVLFGGSRAFEEVIVDVIVASDGNIPQRLGEDVGCFGFSHQLNEFGSCLRQEFQLFVKR